MQARLRAKLAAQSAIDDVALYEGVAKARMQEIMLFSKPLFIFAYKCAQRFGRGAVLQMWSSIDEATDRGSARPTMHYMPFEVVQKLDYKPAFDMARTYDPMSMFVVVIAIRTNDARDSIMHSALLPASVSDSFLPTLENTAALQRINLSAPEPAEQNEDEDDFASLGFAALLSPFAPEVHARLTADSDHTLTDLFGANSAFTGLASGLSVAAPGDMPVSLKLTSTMCAWPACTHEYPLPCVSVQPAAAEEPAAESFPAESNAASDTVEPTQSESSEPAEPAQPLAASEQFSFPFPYFPVSTDPADQRCWCSDCFLQTYCSSDCQAKHWEHNHAQLCQRIRLSFLTQKLQIDEATIPSKSSKKSKKKKKKPTSVAL